MFFLFFLPFIGFIVLAIVRASAEQKKREEAKQREQQDPNWRQTAFTGQTTSNSPVRPSVQTTPVRGAATWQGTSANARPQNTSFASQQKQPQKMHPGHDYCALRPDASSAQDSRSRNTSQKHPEHDLCALRPENNQSATADTSPVPALQVGGIQMNFTPNQVLSGVLFSEIFGKPKAM